MRPIIKTAEVVQITQKNLDETLMGLKEVNAKIDEQKEAVRVLNLKIIKQEFNVYLD